MALRTEQLCKSYGRRRVVDEVSLRVEPGEIVGLLGPNGAGKTTTFYSIVGFVQPDQGHIFLDEAEITHLPMYRRARQGIGYLSQEKSIFRGLTVAQNIRAVLETRSLEPAHLEERLHTLLRELDLEGRAQQRADTLSGGETRRVEVARALAMEPRYMLLDEPFAGIDPRTVEDIQAIIAGLRQRGLGILITDHNVRETLAITDRAYIMVDGHILTSGTGSQLTADPQVRRHYLGEKFQMD
ncbi:MAG: LPS export ABC transporter ATP-binding protein [Candidatus Latescibacteria bacterium]|nr:LPS export ABC transporter ATP-binding protein [Candidatus Latescibacterota bacterium]